MGYDIHITRKEHWSDDGPEITLAEWQAYIASDIEMRLDGYAEAALGDGKTLRVENEGLSVWKAYPHHGTNGNMAWFDFRSGNVVVKNPDEQILAKMWLIAQKLRAQVQGDEGECYDADGNVIS